MKVKIINLRERFDEVLFAHLINDLYKPSFPIGEEVEDPDDIKNRLQIRDPPPLMPVTHALVSWIDENHSGCFEISGFAIAEYYQASRCGLLTYIVVDPSCRRQGLGKLICDRVIEVLKAEAVSRGKELRAVFAEVNDPGRVSEAMDSMNPINRLKFFSRLGAGIIPIPYVQPSLSPDHERARLMFLAGLPIEGSVIDAIASPIIRDFLHEFYQALGVPEPENDPDFQEMEKALHNPMISLQPFQQKQEVEL